MSLTEEQRYWLERDFVLELLKQIPIYVFWKNKDSVYLGCNDLFAHSLGLNTPEDIIGKSDYDLPTSKEESDAYRADDRQVMESRQAKLNIEEYQTFPDGRKIALLTSKVPLMSKDGNVIGVLGIYSDITERKAAEEREKIAIAQAAQDKAEATAEAELRRAVTVFAGSIAHDLRVPLSSLMIITDLFVKSLTHLSTEFKQFIAVQKNVDTSLHLHLEKLDEYPSKMKVIMHEMNNFIDVTLKSMQRLVAGTLSYEDFVVCEIEACLNDVINKYPFQNNEQKLIQIGDMHNFAFLGCPILFYRILFNLLSNSLDQIEKNKRGKIYIATDASEKHNILRIKDTAGGAAPEIVQHIFDGYQTTKKHGTGVGLAFCKLTMQSFGGDITCYSIESDYIEFILSFPKLDN